MFSKKWFTLTEILTTVAITTVVFWWVSISLSSFQDSSEIFSWEQIFTSKIRSEKVSAISWEINCSKTDLSYWKNYFKIFHWIEKNYSCDEKFFWEISSSDWKIFITFYEGPEIQIYKNWSNWWEIYYEKTSWNKISFDLSDDYSYKIKAQNWEEIEEMELIFFNENPWELEEIDVNKILVWSISWKNFKKEEISWDTLSVIFVNSNPTSKIFLRWEEINDAEVSLKTLNWDSSKFDFFSASLFWKKNTDLNIWDILK